jgi:hypothetical protein
MASFEVTTEGLREEQLAWLLWLLTTRRRDQSYSRKDQVKYRHVYNNKPSHSHVPGGKRLESHQGGG